MSRLSRYGMWPLFRRGLLAALMTLPSASSDLLTCAASAAALPPPPRDPPGLLLRTGSQAARSQNTSLLAETAGPLPCVLDRRFSNLLGGLIKTRFIVLEVDGDVVVRRGPDMVGPCQGGLHTWLPTSSLKQLEL